MKAKHLTTAVCLFIACAMLLNLSACSSVTVQAMDLTEGISANKVNEKTADDKFIDNSASFAANLFVKSAKEEENVLISPLSVMLALAMTANGADGETKAEMQQLLGADIPIEELNAYLQTYVNNLPNSENSKLDIANSIWFRDKKAFEINKDFLQTNADYFNAAAYKAPFNDTTINDINNWVSNKTDGMIDKIIEKINNDTIMFLINALTFEALWDNEYNLADLYDGNFTSYKNEKQNAKMMRSMENNYIETDNATGFIKPYKNNEYSFVALLPNEDIALDDFINNLSGESFIKIIKNSKNNTLVTAHIPKFSYDCSIVMNDILEQLGMPAAFDETTADFSNLGKGNDNLYISEVLHKTFIAVDELGTKAGAVTKVEIEEKSAPMTQSVVLDRPFVYAIVHNDTSLPIFMGTLRTL